MGRRPKVNDELFHQLMEDGNDPKRLKGRLREKDKLIKHWRDKYFGRHELFTEIREAVDAFEPYSDYKYQKPEKATSPIVPVLVISDLHIGEIINPKEMEGFNAYSHKIAVKRMWHIIQSFLDWVNISRNQYTINRCHVMLLGDYISGDIHYELQATNEFPVPVQTVKAGYLIGEALRRIAPHFEVVTVDCVGADNHGRLQKKPQCKQKGTNNYSYIVHEIAMLLNRDIKGIVFDMTEGMKQLVEINNHRFLMEHGDTIRGILGIPFYGMERSKAKEAVRRMNETKKSFHYRVLGHWHQPCFFSDTIVNGSLSGTTEYDHSAGRYSHPCQVAFLVHPRHGVFNFTAFRAVDR